MEPEELQEQWRRLERKLDQSLALETELVRQVMMQPTRRRVNRLAIWPMLDVLFCVGVLSLSGMSLAANSDDWRLVAPAILVMTSAIALLVDSLRQRERVSRLDWSGPVAEIQSTLEGLRVAKIRQFKWVILFSPLIGFSGFVVGLQGLVGWFTHHRVNIFDKWNSWWVVSNYVFGLLFVALGYQIAGILARRCHQRSWWQAVLDGISGTSLKAATRDVERWASLRREAIDPTGSP